MPYVPYVSNLPSCLSFPRVLLPCMSYVPCLSYVSCLPYLSCGLAYPICLLWLACFVCLYSCMTRPCAFLSYCGLGTLHILHALPVLPVLFTLNKNVLIFLVRSVKKSKNVEAWGNLNVFSSKKKTFFFVYFEYLS